MLVACRHDRHEIPHLVVRYHRRRLCLPIHDVADRQGGAGLDLLQAQGRSADEQQIVDERLPNLARPLPVCPSGEVHRDIAFHADAVQIALYEHLAAVGDAMHTSIVCFPDFQPWAYPGDTSAWVRLSIDEIIVSEYDSCLMYIPTIGPAHFFLSNAKIRIFPAPSTPLPCRE